MKSEIRMIVLAGLCTLAGCATQEVARDLKHDELSRQYVSATHSPKSFEPGQLCTAASAMLSWLMFDFEEKTPVVELPSGLSAAALCVGVPKGARALEIRAAVTGGGLFATLYDTTVVSPSAMLLDGQFALVEDIESPGLNFGEEGLQGPELKGVTLLTGDRAAARYVVIYVHPSSVEDKVIVRSGADRIPIPHGPYGPVKLRFHP